MDKYLMIKKEFETNADNEMAIAMSKYMRNMFEYYGIQTPKRKEIYKDFLKSEAKSKSIDWKFLDKCYKDKHREFQYLAYDYLLAMKSNITYDDIPKIREYIANKSWWDTVDMLCKVITNISIRDSRVKDLMLKWSKDENIWIRRTAIEYQLLLKDKTDTVVLEKIITNCFGTNEFFINKAIGWALRDYSKTNPKWVRSFIAKYKNQMTSLSINEASKYI